MSSHSIATIGLIRSHNKSLTLGLLLTTWRT